MRVSRHAAWLVGAATWLSAGGDLWAQVSYRTVAVSGQPAPGVGSGPVFASVDTPSINNAGQLVFSGRLTGVGTTSATDDVVYAGAPAALQLAARAGSQAPGMPAGVNYTLFSSVPTFFGQTMINDAGTIAYQAKLTGEGVTTANDYAVFAGPVGSPLVVARRGDQAPGTPAGVVYGGFDVRLNDAGQVALYATLSGPGVGTALANYASAYIGTPGAMQLAARDGDPAPGTAALYGAGGGSMGLITFNDAGQISFWDGLQGPGTTFENRAAVFAGGVGSMQLIARLASPAHDAPFGVNYAGFAAHSTGVNNAGNVGYWATWSGAGVTAANDEVLYAGPMAAPRLLAREGDDAPGTPAGVKYAGFDAPANDRYPLLNDAGHAFFASKLSGPGVTAANDQAVFAGPYDAPQLVFREGGPAPGTPAGVNFWTVTTDEWGIGSAGLNDAGQVAAVVQLTGSVTTANDAALYLFDPMLGPLLIAREGSPFEVRPGVFRTVADWGITLVAGRNDDMVSGFNDHGVLAFRLKFTDNTTGVFTAAIPEPAAASVLALATSSLLLHRTRRDRSKH